MKQKLRINKISCFRLGLVPIVIVISSLLMGCMKSSGFQESNTYPVEIFSEMHYSQAYKSQEPPRIKSSGSSIPFKRLASGPSEILNVPEKEERQYDEFVAKNLYRVNCSMCHGVDATGGGTVSKYITSERSFYAENKGKSYEAPPNLLESTGNKFTDIDSMINFVRNGSQSGGPMPPYGKLLSEAEMRDIVTYIFGKTNNR